MQGICIFLGGRPIKNGTQFLFFDILFPINIPLIA